MEPVKKRIETIDLLRGIVMVIMALDHTRDLYHTHGFTDDPLNFQTTSAILFFTRWITHYCAPIFVFLAGASIFLQGLRKSKKELAGFLFKRGIWLIFAEFAIVTLGMTFNFSFDLLVMQVIWAIGISMVIMSLLIWLPYYAILAIGAIIVFGHNILDPIEANHKGEFGFIWDLLHHGRFTYYPLAGNYQLLIIYPFVPWLGLMMLGFCFGKLYDPSTNITIREKTLIWGGAGLLLLFVLLRSINLYGDPEPWEVQNNALFTFLSYLNVYKYPPSLLYICITIGPALLFLALFEGVRNRVTQFFIVFGRVPFLYYVLHFYVLHIIRAFLFVYDEGHTWKEGFAGTPGFTFRFLLPGEGYHLWQVYIAWIATIIILYPVCLWFSNYKAKHKKWWLSYL